MTDATPLERCCEMGIMQLIYPNHQPDLTDTDLAHVYAWPAEAQPFVRCNFAHAVDGSVTDADGKSKGVSNDLDRRVFALLRATCDAVLVGAGTARAENYGPISVRAEFEQIRAAANAERHPVLVLVTQSGDIDPRSKAFSGGPDSVIVITHKSVNPGKLAALHPYAKVLTIGAEEVDLPAAARALAELGLVKVLCEGGPHLFTDLVSSGVADELCLTTTPKLVGGPKASFVTELLPTSRPLSLESLLEEDGTLLARWSLPPA